MGEFDISDAPFKLPSNTPALNRRAQSWLDRRSGDVTAPVDWSKVKWIPKAKKSTSAETNNPPAAPCSEEQPPRPKPSPNYGIRVYRRARLAREAALNSQPAPDLQPPKRPAKPELQPIAMNPFEQIITELELRKSKIDGVIQSLRELEKLTPQIEAPSKDPAPELPMTTSTRKVDRKGSANYKLRQVIAQQMGDGQFTNRDIMQKVRMMPEFAEVDSTKIAQVAASMGKAGELVLVEKSGKSPVWKLPASRV